LANAVHFKSAWAHQFTSGKDGSFYVTPSKEVAVKMMTREHGFQYYHDSLLQFTALELPYEVIILLYKCKFNILKNIFFCILEPFF